MTEAVVTDAAVMGSAVRQFARLQRLVPLGNLRTQRDYLRARRMLDRIIDSIGNDESGPAADLAETLGIFIDRYEARHVRMPATTPSDVLRLLMEQHGLVQSDLPEVGSQGVVSEILRGKRRLNARQIQALTQRFGIAADLFLGASR
jgi:HTH-type transcriptional regulator / antitoxin HigA